MPLSATHPVPPITHTPCLRIWKSKLEQMSSVFGPLWQAENDCLAVKHPIVASKLKALQKSHSEATTAVEQAVAEGPCCEDCQRTADEWARFEAERPDRLDDVDNLDAIDRELQAEKDAADLLVMGNIEGSPRGKDEPAVPLYWKFTPDVDDAPTPAPEPFHSIHPSNCGCDGCVNRGLREVQDAVRRMPVATQAIDIRRPA